MKRKHHFGFDLLLIFIGLQLSCFAHADFDSFETVVRGNASFDSLYEDSLLPKKNIQIDSTHGGTLDTLSQSDIFPVQNYGYPSGTLSTNLGGRTSDDTETFTLGVPLNAPQGGGADFSIFPSFLWSQAELSPQGASGKIQLKLWTRDILDRAKNKSFSGQFTSSENRQLQSNAIGAKTGPLAMIIGVNTGLQTGPSGSLSYALIKKLTQQLNVHLIATEQNGLSPGSLTYPTPSTHKITWRLIPVLEGHQEISDDLAIESTLYADLQELSYQDPSPLSSSDDHIQQYGIENAVLYQNYTLGLAARTIHDQSSTFHELTEWPMNARVSRDFNKDEPFSSKLTLTADYLNHTGLYPGAKAALRFTPAARREVYFAELSSIPKMPSLLNRYYQIPGVFSGNPELQPELVHALLVGDEHHQGGFSSSSTLKVEFRNQVQISENKTVENAGNATLFYFKEAINYELSPHFKWMSTSLLTDSHLQSNSLPYPDLPAFAQSLGLEWTPTDRFSFHTQGKYTGPSIASDGRFHPNYTLVDLDSQYRLNENLIFSGGIDNVFNDRAQVILDYPLPGALIYLSMKATF